MDCRHVFMSQYVMRLELVFIPEWAHYSRDEINVPIALGAFRDKGSWGQGWGQVARSGLGAGCEWAHKK